MLRFIICLVVFGSVVMAQSPVRKVPIAELASGQSPDAERALGKNFGTNFPKLIRAVSPLESESVRLALLPEVAAELTITEEQARKLLQVKMSGLRAKDVLSELGKKSPKDIGILGELEMASFVDLLHPRTSKEVERVKNAVESILDKKQFARLRQIYLQKLFARRKVTVFESKLELGLDVERDQVIAIIDAMRKRDAEIEDQIKAMRAKAAVDAWRDAIGAAESKKMFGTFFDPDLKSKLTQQPQIPGKNPRRHLPERLRTDVP